MNIISQENIEYWKSFASQRTHEELLSTDSSYEIWPETDAHFDAGLATGKILMARHILKVLGIKYEIESGAY